MNATTHERTTATTPHELMWWRGPPHAQLPPLSYLCPACCSASTSGPQERVGSEASMYSVLGLYVECVKK